MDFCLIDRIVPVSIKKTKNLIDSYPYVLLRDDIKQTI